MGKPVLTIEFEDHGQDFLKWTINEDGDIIDCIPFQFDLWSKWKVCNVYSIQIGGFVEIFKERIDGKTLDYLTIKYPVVDTTESEATND